MLFVESRVDEAILVSYMYRGPTAKASQFQRMRPLEHMQLAQLHLIVHMSLYHSQHQERHSKLDGVCLFTPLVLYGR